MVRVASLDDMSGRLLSRPRPVRCNATSGLLPQEPAKTASSSCSISRWMVAFSMPSIRPSSARTRISPGPMSIRPCKPSRCRYAVHSCHRHCKSYRAMMREDISSTRDIAASNESLCWRRMSILAMNGGGRWSMSARVPRSVQFGRCRRSSCLARARRPKQPSAVRVFKHNRPEVRLAWLPRNRLDLAATLQTET